MQAHVLKKKTASPLPWFHFAPNFGAGPSGESPSNCGTRGRVLRLLSVSAGWKGGWPPLAAQKEQLPSSWEGKWLRDFIFRMSIAPGGLSGYCTESLCIFVAESVSVDSTRSFVDMNIPSPLKMREEQCQRARQDRNHEQMSESWRCKPSIQVSLA